MVEDLQAQLAALAEEKDAAHKQHQADMAEAHQRLNQANAEAKAAAEKHRASKLLKAVSSKGMPPEHLGLCGNLCLHALHVDAATADSAPDMLCANFGRLSADREPAGEGNG